MGIVLCCSLALTAGAQNKIVVTPDGTGDYTTIQAALDAVPDNTETIVYVKNGTYDEHINVTSTSKKINLIGESRDGVILTSSVGCASGVQYNKTTAINLAARDFYAENITFQNTSGKAGGQALAVYLYGDRQTFYHCSFKGYQDTHRTKKGCRSYYKECLIEGATDFIYAGGTAWFEDCTIHCIGNGFITAPEDISINTLGKNGDKIYLGFIFHNCTITRASNVSAGSVYLGRPWASSMAGSIFLNCNLGDVINAAGWTTMGSNTGTNSFFGEYGSKTNTGSSIDVSKRISWSHQISEEDYDAIMNQHAVDSIFLVCTKGSVKYDPEAVITKCSVAASIADTKDKPTWSYDGSKLCFSTQVKGFRIYSSAGNMVRKANHVTSFPVDDLPRGIYIIDCLTDAARATSQVIIMR